MSIRYFCDVCSTEIVGQSDRVRRKLGDVMIEVMVCNKGTWNAGHICEPCVIRVAAEGKHVGHDGGYVAYEAAERRRTQTSVLTAIPMNGQAAPQ